MNNTIRSVTTVACRQFPHLAAALAVAACATTFVVSAGRAQVLQGIMNTTAGLPDVDVIRLPQGAEVRVYAAFDGKRCYYYYEDPRTKEHKRLSAEYVAQELRRQEEQERERSGHRKPQKAQRSAYDTTNGTTDPQPGWWVPWGSVRNALLKRRKVDANVTLAEKREDVGGNGSGSRQ